MSLPMPRTVYFLVPSYFLKNCPTYTIDIMDPVGELEVVRFLFLAIIVSFFGHLWLFGGLHFFNYKFWGRPSI